MLNFEFFKNKRVIAFFTVILLLLVGHFNGLLYNRGDIFGIFSAPKDTKLKFNFKFTDTSELLDIKPFSKEKYNNLDPTFITIGDINKDGFEDAVFVMVDDGRRGLISVQMNREGVRYQRDKMIEDTINSFEHGAKILSLALVDLDNDGWEDLVVTYNKSCAGFYKNMNGHFINTKWKKICSKQGDMAYIHVADFNNDGFVDIYFTSLILSRKEGFYPILADNSSIGGKNILAINQAGKFFEDKTDEYGIVDFGFTWTAAIADYNNDGFVDIINVNDAGYNKYFENVSGKKFINLTNKFFKQNEQSHSMSGEVADFDNDGVWGAYISNLSSKTRLSYGHNAFWKRTESGSFKNNARKLRIDSCGYSWGARALEPERDGNLSLLVTNLPNHLNHLQNVRSIDGTSNEIVSRLTDERISQRARGIQQNLQIKGRSISEDDAKLLAADDFLTRYYSKDPQKNCFFMRVRGEYYDISENVGITDAKGGKTVVETDFNNDGVPDLLIGNIDASPIMYYGTYSGVNDWLGFKLRGKISNSDSIGAVVEVQFQKYKLKKQIFPTNGYQSLSTKRLVFGIDKKEKIQGISIKWPSGKSQTVSQYQINHYNEIYEN